MSITRRRLLQSVPALAAGALGACSEEPDTGPRLPRPRLRVVTTTLYAADLVRRIGDRAVEVISLQKPGENPHQWQPSAGDIAEMRIADIVIFNGLGIERRLTETPETLRAAGLFCTTLSDAIPPEKLVVARPGAAPDPHIWMDPRLWMYGADAVAAVLTEAAPKNADYFRDHAHETRVELQRLHDWADRLLTGVPADDRFLFCSHDSMATFCSAYRLEYRSLGDAEGNASAEMPADLIAWKDEHHIKSLFYEPVANVDRLKLICHPAGISPNFRIFSLSPAAPGTKLTGSAQEHDAGDIFGSFRYTVDILQKRLSLD